MKKLFLLLLLAYSSFEISFATQSNDTKDLLETSKYSKSTSESPTLIITSIINRTPYDFMLFDRFNNIALHVPAEYGAKFSYVIENYENIVINGSMKDCMARSAQFVLEPVNLPHNIDNPQYHYLNFCITPGGINDGSNVTVGKTGTMVAKFFGAGSNFGCSMQSIPLKNFKSNEIEIFLEFDMNQSDIKNHIFRISSSCSFVTDQSIENPIDVIHKKNAKLDTAPSSSIPSMAMIACIAGCIYFGYDKFFEKD